MATYAVVDQATGTAVNVILWDGEGEWPAAEGLALVELPEGSPVGIGWTYQDGEWRIPPDRLVKEEVA